MSVQEILVLPVHYFNLFFPIVLGRLSLSKYVSLANNSAGQLTMPDGNRTIFTSMHRDYMYVLLYAKMHGL